MYEVQLKGLVSMISCTKAQKVLMVVMGEQKGPPPHESGGFYKENVPCSG
jgi:hypothetical protein